MTGIGSTEIARLIHDGARLREYVDDARRMLDRPGVRVRVQIGAPEDEDSGYVQWTPNVTARRPETLALARAALAESEAALVAIEKRLAEHGITLEVEKDEDVDDETDIPS